MKKLLVISTLIILLIVSQVMATEKDNIPKSKGVHHVGLAVKNLDITSKFFIEGLGFEKVMEKPDYPAIFVSDGTVMVTLWQVNDANSATPFNRKENIGLHHMAFKLSTFEELDRMHERLKNYDGVDIEFSPELAGEGSSKHMIFKEPGGIRLEFIVPK